MRRSAPQTIARMCRGLALALAFAALAGPRAARADSPNDLLHPATDLSDEDAKEDADWVKIHGHEKARFDIPDTIAFTITNIAADTPQDGVAVIRAYDLELKKKSHLVVFIAPTADHFVDPRGVDSYPTSALRYEAQSTLGGQAAGSSLGAAGQFLTLLTCDALVTTCQTTLKFTLAAAIRPTIAGDHTLGLMVRVATIH